MYVPGSKGAPSFVRLYQYPNFGGPQSALANKSFFKADKVTMLWNKKGRTAVYLTFLYSTYFGFNCFVYCVAFAFNLHVLKYIGIEDSC